MGDGGVGRIRGGSSADAELGELRCGDRGGPENRLTTFGWEVTQILSEPQLNLLLANVAPLLESCKWDRYGKSKTMYSAHKKRGSVWH